LKVLLLLALLATVDILQGFSPQSDDESAEQGW
jgi:hypothetical protein